MLKLKRISAYIVEFFLVAIISGIICMIVNVQTNTNLMETIKSLIKDYQFGDYSLLELYHQLATVFQASDQANNIRLLITLVTMVFTWIIVPTLLNSQTFGMKIMHIRIDNNGEKIPVRAIIIRALLFSGLGFYIISFMFLYIVSADIYTLLVLILIITQLLFIIYGFSMILYSSNGSNRIDKLCQIKIIEVKK